jgi:hypothetical protein
VLPDHVAWEELLSWEEAQLRGRKDSRADPEQPCLGTVLELSSSPERESRWQTPWSHPWPLPTESTSPGKGSCSQVR